MVTDTLLLPQEPPTLLQTREIRIFHAQGHVGVNCSLSLHSRFLCTAAAVEVATASHPTPEFLLKGIIVCILQIEVFVL